MTNSYDVFGCVGDAEIFLGSSDMLQIAVLTANNNLGPTRYQSVVIYDVKKENEEIVSREVVQRLHLD